MFLCWLSTELQCGDIGTNVELHSDNIIDPTHFLIPGQVVQTQYEHACEEAVLPMHYHVPFVQVTWSF